MIIGFYSYCSGVGKDTAAQMLAEILEARGASVTCRGFADEMKLVCADALGIREGTREERIAQIDRLKLYGEVQWFDDYPDEIEAKSGIVTGRDFIIGVGGNTAGDYGIRRLDQQFWIRHALDYDTDYLLMTDLRFTPEAVAVREHGDLVEIQREPNLGHNNEDRIVCRWTLDNNGSLEDLHENVEILASMLP